MSRSIESRLRKIEQEVQRLNPARKWLITPEQAQAILSRLPDAGKTIEELRAYRLKLLQGPDTQ